MTKGLSWVIVAILILSTLPFPSTQAQIIEDPVSEIVEATPVEVYNDNERITMNVSQGLQYHPLTTVLTGPGYFHRITVMIEDDIDRVFGGNDLYQITYHLDLVSTMFDPSDKKITVEDGINSSIILDLETDYNDQLNLTSTIISVAEQTTEVNMTTTLQTYFVQPRQYNFDDSSYTIQTMPLHTEFTANSSFSWRFLEPTYLLLDENMLLNQSYTIQVDIELEITTSTEEDSTIRLEIAGDAASYNVQNPSSLRIEVPIDTLYEVQLSTLSGYIAFEIVSISIQIDPYNLEEEIILPDLPPFGWIMGVLLYTISLLMVLKFMRVKLEMEEEEQ